MSWSRSFTHNDRSAATNLWDSSLDGRPPVARTGASFDAPTVQIGLMGRGTERGVRAQPRLSQQGHGHHPQPRVRHPDTTFGHACSARAAPCSAGCASWAMPSAASMPSPSWARSASSPTWWPAEHGRGPQLGARSTAVDDRSQLSGTRVASSSAIRATVKGIRSIAGFHVSLVQRAVRLVFDYRVALAMQRARIASRCSHRASGCIARSGKRPSCAKSFASIQ